MPVAGIDIGSLSTVVILDEGRFSSKLSYLPGEQQNGGRKSHADGAGKAAFHSTTCSI